MTVTTMVNPPEPEVHYRRGRGSRVHHFLEESETFTFKSRRTRGPCLVSPEAKVTRTLRAPGCEEVPTIVV